MPSMKRCIEVYLNHSSNEAGSLSGPMLDMWRIGQGCHEVINSSAEVKSCAKHGLELKSDGVVNLISQIGEQHETNNQNALGKRSKV